MQVMQVSWGILCEQVSSSSFQKPGFKKGSPMWRVNKAFRVCVPCLADLPFGSLAWADQLHHTVRTMENAFVDAVEAKNFSALLVSAYTTVIDARSSQRLGRFSSLKEHLLLDLLPARLV
ncbi:TPA: hypothetical protein ACH3X1_012484 [Trebouxia sp. C0004]